MRLSLDLLTSHSPGGKGVGEKSGAKKKKAGAKKKSSPPRTTTASPSTAPATPAASAEETQRNSVMSDVKSLASKSGVGAVSMADLREKMSGMDRATQDRHLRKLRDEGKIILYQNDDRASLKRRDHDAALMEADTPRHLVYVDNSWSRKR